MRLDYTGGMKSRVRKLDDKAVLEIRRMQGKETAVSLAKRFKVSEGAIRAVWHRRRWASLED